MKWNKTPGRSGGPSINKKGSDLDGDCLVPVWDEFGGCVGRGHYWADWFDEVSRVALARPQQRGMRMKNNNPRHGREALGAVAFFGLLFGIIYFLSINL